MCFLWWNAFFPHAHILYTVDADMIYFVATCQAKQALCSSCLHQNWFRKIDPKSIVFCVYTYCILQCSVFSFLLNLNIYYYLKCSLTLMHLILLNMQKALMHIELTFTCFSQCVTHFETHLLFSSVKLGHPFMCCEWPVENERKQAVGDSPASLLLEYSLLLNLTGKHNLPPFIHFRHCNNKLHNASSGSKHKSSNVIRRMYSGTTVLTNTQSVTLLRYGISYRVNYTWKCLFKVVQKW